MSAADLFIITLFFFLKKTFFKLALNHLSFVEKPVETPTGKNGHTFKLISFYFILSLTKKSMKWIHLTPPSSSSSYFSPPFFFKMYLPIRCYV